MSVTELRKELKDMRKSVMPTPVSRMKKSECAAEIERLKGIHRGEEKKVAEVLSSAEVPTKVAKTVKKVQEKAHDPRGVSRDAKGEETVKKTVGVSKKETKVETKKEEKPKSKAGSEEMKARMAKLREMRKAKKSE